MNHYLPVHPWSGIMVLRAVDQTACRLSAEDLPVFRSATTSKAIFCPSLRVRMPARSTALMCTKTSLPPPSGWIKPKPLWSLNHFHGSLRHITLLSDTSATRPHVSAAGLLEILRKAVKPTRHLPARPSCLRQKLNTATWGLLVGSQSLPGKSLEKRLAIWPTGPHLQCCLSDSFITVGSGAKPRGIGPTLITDIDRVAPGACAPGTRASNSRPMHLKSSRSQSPMQVFVRDNNIDQALRVLKKKMQRKACSVK